MWKRLIKRLFVKVIGKERIKKTIVFFAKVSDIDLLLLAYNNIGILKYQNFGISGEKFLIEKILKKNIVSEKPVFFDVGANVGMYSLELKKIFPNAEIWAFEPNQESYKKLVNLVDNGIRCVNIGFGECEKNIMIYSDLDKTGSSHATIYKGVYEHFYNAKKFLEIPIHLEKLDDFCRSNNISEIDFLKIDTEGNELNVLKGASDILKKGSVKIIQFEFGECNVFSKVFLKDFYDILGNYDIYRLDTENLISLSKYNSLNEIFRYQNIIAVNKSFLCVNA
ncbi:methyltransferase FkbM family [Chloroherpeton thalassium ATCC 35110]|uniref:Methyltransferase FkbM family n=1 Tax=Chloroherpeton thalassium (strain ATCC 35110 / GB-78) TaxID=517418 RepID=B3QXQ1_CHLT3|nr:FkbM family methyltransferase [Chloroherpeton thalassium]ACF14966.1 methyltransferase FkbM family [Chloroherpeton thalassium ATCC 35110]